MICITVHNILYIFVNDDPMAKSNKQAENNLGITIIDSINSE